MDWSVILQNVLTVVVSTVTPVLVGMLAVWLKQKRNEYLDSLDGKWEWAAQDAVRIAVMAAEQSGLAKLIDDTATAKKAYACEVAEQYLRRYNITVDLDVLLAMIEAEVFKQFHSGDSATPAVVVNSR